MQGSSTGEHWYRCLGRRSTVARELFSTGRRNLQPRDALHCSSKGITSEGPLDRNLAWTTFKDRTSLNNGGQSGEYKLKAFSILHLLFKVGSQRLSYANLGKFGRKFLHLLSSLVIQAYHNQTWNRTLNSYHLGNQIMVSIIDKL